MVLAMLRVPDPRPPPKLLMPPPVVAVLPERVELVTVRVAPIGLKLAPPPFWMPPPVLDAVLPERVELVTVRVALFWMAPPVDAGDGDGDVAIAVAVLDGAAGTSRIIAREGGIGDGDGAVLIEDGAAAAAICS